MGQLTGYISLFQVWRLLSFIYFVSIYYKYFIYLIYCKLIYFSAVLDIRVFLIHFWQTCSWSYHRWLPTGHQIDLEAFSYKCLQKYRWRIDALMLESVTWTPYAYHKVYRKLDDNSLLWVIYDGRVLLMHIYLRGVCVIWLCSWHSWICPSCTI